MIKLVELVRVSLGEIRYKRMSREKRDIIPRKKKREKRENRFLERRKMTVSKRFRLHSSQDRPYNRISYSKRAQISRQRMGTFLEAD